MPDADSMRMIPLEQASTCRGLHPQCYCEFLPSEIKPVSGKVIERILLMMMKEDGR